MSDVGKNVTDPLEIMNEIGRNQPDIRYEDGGIVSLLTEQWQELRKAVEAQADWIEFQNQKHEECARVLENTQLDLEIKKMCLRNRDAYVKGLKQLLNRARAKLEELEEFVDVDELREFNEEADRQPISDRGVMQQDEWDPSGNAVPCRWERIDVGMPIQRDHWYLFGGYDDNGNWVFNKYHYSLNGEVNGWSKEVLLKKGITHWCLPAAPKKDEDRSTALYGKHMYVRVPGPFGEREVDDIPDESYHDFEGKD